MSKDVAVLGVGMHPWGKWGQSFVRYGVKAAQDALKTGMPMELVLRELYEDDEHVYFTWNWKPTDGGSNA